MSNEYSGIAQSAAVRSNDVRRAIPLDDIDRILLDQLSYDARTTNSALAALAGIAPSTCLGRVRSLVDRGVIRGFHADIDPAAFGRDLQAMVAVRVRANARHHLGQLAEQLAAIEEVLNVYFISGANDFFVHVATANSDELRRFVLDHLSAHPAFASTETILIFEHLLPRRRPVEPGLDTAPRRG
ncbi:AsnC family transcriptional regulator [Rhodococcus sp. SRB_17]|nr:AsnC family transcriptional regulator [Rhodococcus sp. SRB_17]